MHTKTKVRIKRTDLQKLASISLKEISPQSLALWLKVQTDGEFVVFSRKIALKLIDYALNHSICHKNDFIGKGLDVTQEELDILKNYWL